LLYVWTEDGSVVATDKHDGEVKKADEMLEGVLSSKSLYVTILHEDGFKFYLGARTRIRYSAIIAATSDVWLQLRLWSSVLVATENLNIKNVKDLRRIVNYPWVTVVIVDEFDEKNHFLNLDMGLCWKRKGAFCMLDRGLQVR